MTFTLRSPEYADELLARLFRLDPLAELFVSEDIAFFESGWLSLGQLRVAPADGSQAALRSAVRYGGFEWKLPDMQTTISALRPLLVPESEAAAQKRGDSDRKNSEAYDAKISRILDAISSVAARSGLTHPRFDAQSIAQMPFRRPTTVIADTSGVLQGGLDFVARYLQPMARIKVPAVVHMEVVNQSHRFMKLRRAEKVRRIELLLEHLLSQAGQRALLRLELRPDTEVERTGLAGEPLRSAFKEDRDPDFQNLNLNVPVAGYADRLVLEAARQHQAYASPGHPTLLLTGDQGLAKMAIAEGVAPLFFKSTAAAHLFGRTLTGAYFHPLYGRAMASPLSALLWEFATAFGRVKLVSNNSEFRVEIGAIGKDLGWSTFHSWEDLLWVTAPSLPPWPQSVAPDPKRPGEPGAESAPDDNSLLPAPATMASHDQRPRKKPDSKPRAVKQSTQQGGKLSELNRAGVPFYRMSVPHLVSLIDSLAVKFSLSDADVGEVVEASHSSTLGAYKRFLASGGFIRSAEQKEAWIASDAIPALADALREPDPGRVSELLQSTPSFSAFMSELRKSPQQPVSPFMPPRVWPTYLVLGEITCEGAPIADEGYFATPANPSVQDFVGIALATFSSLRGSDNLVSVGEWLEALIRKHGIHPIRAHERLQEASAGGLIRRFTEGSTTDTKHDDHAIKVLQSAAGRPAVRTVHLYRGDFLIPGKSSTSLRLEALEP